MRRRLPLSRRDAAKRKRQEQQDGYENEYVKGQAHIIAQVGLFFLPLPFDNQPEIGVNRVTILPAAYRLREPQTQPTNTTIPIVPSHVSCDDEA